MTAVDHSFFAADLTVKGSVSGRGRLYVQGRVEGDVTVNQLALTPDGTITGKARADHVVLSGNLIGTLCAHSVTISSTGHLSGLVEYETLGVEPGGTFEAECRPATAPSLAMERECATCGDALVAPSAAKVRGSRVLEYFSFRRGCA